MAVAGDVVIKLAADVAELKAGLSEASAKLDEFGKTAAKTGEQIDGFASILSTSLKGIGIGAVIGLVVGEIKKLASETSAASLEAEKMSRALGVNVEQV